MASHMEIRQIAFTGSTATGRKIQEYAAKSNLKRVSLELGIEDIIIMTSEVELTESQAASHHLSFSTTLISILPFPSQSMIRMLAMHDTD